MTSGSIGPLLFINVATFQCVPQGNVIQMRYISTLHKTIWTETYQKISEFTLVLFCDLHVISPESSLTAVACNMTFTWKY